MEIFDVKINHIREPLGFMMKGTPVVSYKVRGSRGMTQKSLRITVSDGDNIIYESGEIDQVQPVYPLPVDLTPVTRYTVTLDVVSDADEKARGRTWYETGRMGLPWKAQWITPALNDDVPVLGRRFSLDKDIECARLYIGCGGLYSIYINGERAGNEYLTPYCNSYSDWMQIITHDVTALLKKNENLLEITLAGGWYKGRFGLHQKDNIYGDTLAVIAELHITFKDGGRQEIITDENWFSRKSVYKSAEIYNGVSLDFTRNTTETGAVRITELDKTKLEDRLSLPVIIKETLPVINVLTTPEGRLCLDMGQNMVGWLRVNTSAFPERDFSIRHFEVLDQKGNVYTENLRQAKQAFNYKTDGKPRAAEPEFTFYGFRYAHIEGLEGLSHEEIKNAFTGCAAYSDMNSSGFIETSNPLVNRLFLNALWGQKGNFVDVPTDCPQRDERLGWTGDAQVFCGTACFNMDTTAFFRKYMYDIKQEQNRRNGGVPHYVPSFKYSETQGHDSASSSAWGDAATIIPWTIYLHSGDRYLLESQYPGMKAWVDYIRRLDTGSFLWDTGFHFGDWLALDTPRPHMPMGTTPNAMIASAYYLYSAVLVSKAAAALGFNNDALEYSDLAEKIRKAMQKEFITPNGRVASDTQTADIIALFMGFAQDRGKAAAMLNEKIQRNDGRLNTGFVGTAYLCRVLSDNGYNDTAYKLFLNREYPGWLYEVEKGATTIWERWNSIMPDGSLGDAGMNSFNHYAYGAVIEWVYRNAAGIQPLEESPGFGKIRLAPQPNPRLKQLKTRYNSAFGLYRSDWEISHNELHFTFEIPFSAEAEIILPDAPCEIFINGIKTKYTQGMILRKGVYDIKYQPVVCYYTIYNLDSPAKDIFEREDLKTWLRENIPEFKNIMFYVFLSPVHGTLRDFLNSQGITVDSEIENKINDSWLNIRSWDLRKQ